MSYLEVGLAILGVPVFYFFVGLAFDLVERDGRKITIRRLLRFSGRMCIFTILAPFAHLAVIVTAYQRKGAPTIWKLYDYLDETTNLPYEHMPKKK